MSVQLIVYPQNYEGEFNDISSSSTQFVVNGINFSGLNSTPTYESSAANPSQDTINNAPPIVSNSWYRFRSTNPSYPSYPEVANNNIFFYIPPAAVGSATGVYQKLGNLVPGQQYELNLTMGSGSEGFIIFQIYDGTTFVSSSVAAIGASTITHTFTSTAPDNIVMVYYYTTISDVIEIESIGVEAIAGSPSGAIQLLEDGQVICDLYEDEDLPLTLSVDDFKNVAEKVQSYSKAFNLPSTKRNNRIFDAIFEITREYDGLIFNPYKRTKCVLKQDGFILFEGYLRMLDITDKEGEISYNVNLYSEVIALADTLKDRAFRDLDFTELEHDYNKTEIKRSWNDAGTGITYTNPSTSGFRDAFNTVKYPFVDWNHQFIKANNPGAPPISGPADGNPMLPSLETAFRPFINIKYLIDRIFEASEFTYESTFFNTTDFGKLYMDFNWGGETPETGSGTLSTGDPYVVSTGSFQPLRIISNDFPSNAGYDNTTFKFTSGFDNQTYIIDTNFEVTNLNNSADLEWYWRHKDSAGNIIDSNGYSPWLGGAGPLAIPWVTTLYLTLNLNDTLEFLYESTAGNSYQSASELTVSTGFTIATNNTLLQTLRGELGQWDFLKGLLTMFNLVTLVDENNPDNIIIEPYTDVFIPTATGGTTLANRGIQHDWTDKIDVSEMKLTPLTDLNKKTMFKFVEDDDDYSFNQYKNQVGGHLYGSYLSDAGNEFNILDGEEEIVAEPFAATLVKPLMSQFPEFITPAIYSMGDDGVSEGFENSPRIMYNNGIKSTGVSYYIPPQNGLSSENQTNFLQFSHLSEIPTSNVIPSTTLDFHFGICQLMPGVGVPTPNNLFGLYWLPYYNELYNPNTRTMTIKVNLSPADINTFKFNDRVFIKNRVFRVNKIDYKPNDLATVEFILIP